MESMEPIWKRFVACKFTQTQGTSFSTQNSQSNSSSSIPLGSRSLNLTDVDADTAGLMRDLTLTSVEDLLSEKASQELASRCRYVDFVRRILSCSIADSSGRERKVDVAVKSIQAIHSALVVDKAAQELQNVLLAELDDISPDRVPLIVDAILAPLLAASRRRQSSSVMLGRASDPSGPLIDDTAAAGFLVALDILPKVLGLTSDVPALAQGAPVPESARGLSGAQYKECVMSSLFRARWPDAVSIGMCQTLRDLDLDERQLKVAVSRVLRHLRKNAKLHDLPPLTYQLLLLAGRGCKQAALEGVIRVFDRLDVAAEAADREDAAATDSSLIPIRRGGRLGVNSTEELRFVEGTILLHFNFAMKQDHNLASCVLKGFQRRATAPEIGRSFTPFRVALLLSLSRIQRFSQPVLDLVQDIISDCLVYDHLREGSAWLEGEEELARGGRRGGGNSNGGGGSDHFRAEVDDGVSDGEDGGGASAGGSMSSTSSAVVVERVLLAVVRSSRGWDHLVGSLLTLGLQLLDRGGSGAATGGVTSAAGAAKSLLEKLQRSHSQRALLRASQLGRMVLMETFKTHEIVRRQVLTSVLEQVTARSQGVMGYVKLLGLLAKRNPNLLLDDAEAVRGVFGYISVLPPAVAERFLLAVAPLLRLRPRLQDNVVLPLRKALFSREERARLVAVGGLVLLLGIQSPQNTGTTRGPGESHGGTQLSQTSQTSNMSERHAVAPLSVGGGNRALSLAEGFGLLRRCLTQQLVVRSKLYDGLLSSFGRGSLEFQLDTVSLLAGHLRRFVDLAVTGAGADAGSSAGGGPPLLLGRCLDPNTGDIVEPLPLLIGCLHSMLVSGRKNIMEHVENSNPGDTNSDSMANDGPGRQEDVRGAANAAMVALRESLDELSRDLRRLSAAVSSSVLEEFGLDKVADFSPIEGPVARAKLATAALLCGSYEALMQGSLLSLGRTTDAVVTPRRVPAAVSIRALLRLFDRRQNLLELVRPSLPTLAQQRAKKGSSGSSSIGSSLGGDSESAPGFGVAGAGLPGFSATGCFGLTLYPGGMPCLGMAFVEDMLAVLNIEAEKDEYEEDSEGDAELDPGVVRVDAEDSPIEAVREDLSLQRLTLETCRGHLRTLRTSTAAAGAGISVEIGAGWSSRGDVTTLSASGLHDSLQDEVDAAKAGRTAAKRCTSLAPLLLQESFRQLAEGNNSGAAKEAAAVAKASSSKGGKKKGTGSSGAEVGRDMTKKKTGRASSPAESLSELALACFEQCVLIAAYSSPRARVGASRTADVLEAAYKGIPDSKVQAVDPAGRAETTSVLSKHACALVQTLTNLILGNQAKEAEIVCRILSHLTRLLRLETASLEAHAASLRLVCKEQRVNSPVLAKAVTSLYLQAYMSVKTNRGNIDALRNLAVQICACVGLLDEDEAEEEEEPPTVSFRIINNYTVTAISEVAVGAIETCIEDAEYALRLIQKASLARQARVAAQTPEGVLSAFRNGGGAAGLSQSSGTASEDGLSSDGFDSGKNSDSDSDAAGVRSDGGSGERDPLDRRETLVCDRLEMVMLAMTVLLGSRLDRRPTEKLVSTASRVFRAITKVLKVRLSLKRAYVGLGLKRVLESKKGFTEALQSLLPQLEGEKGSKVTKNNISRQSRLVPTLIFQMEECDVHLLKLAKLRKGSSLDLSKWVTSRVDRDFRIDHKIIATCQEELRGSRDKRKRQVKDKKESTSAKPMKKNKNSSVIEAEEKKRDEENGSDEEEGEGGGHSDEEESSGRGGRGGGAVGDARVNHGGDEDTDDNDDDDDGGGDNSEEEDEGSSGEE